MVADGEVVIPTVDKTCICVGELRKASVVLKVFQTLKLKLGSFLC